MKLQKEIGRRIKIIRLSVRRRTQEEFGSLISVTAQSVCGYELGDNLPSIETAIAIAKVGNVSLDWLLTGKEGDHDSPPQELSEDEVKMLALFRIAPKDHRQAVLKLLAAAVELKEFRKR